MPFLNKGTTVSTVGCHDWKTEEKVRFLDEDTGMLHEVPAGFQTDFASVPRMVQWLFPAYGLYTLAAIVHDFYCVMLADFKRLSAAAFSEKYGIAEPPLNSRQVDALFRKMMQDLGVPVIRRWVMWTGVRWGAMFKASRRDGILATLPGMIFWSLLSFPIVAPISSVVGIGLVVDWTINKMVGLFCK